MAMYSRHNHLYEVALPGFLAGLASLVCLAGWHSQWLWAALVLWVLISGLGIAVGYHRVLTHGALVLPKPVEYVLSFLGAIGLQGSALVWVAGHRQHHVHADYMGDLHSPFHGNWHAFAGWMRGNNVKMMYAGSLAHDPFHRFVYQHYTAIICCFPLLLCLIHPKLALAYFVAVLLSQLQENSVNLFCHRRRWGYRNFHTADDSTNNLLLGYLGWGQGWHNNHHAKPNMFNYGTRWWELDPAMIFYPLLKAISK